MDDMKHLEIAFVFRGATWLSRETWINYRNKVKVIVQLVRNDSLQGAETFSNI